MKHALPLIATSVLVAASLPAGAAETLRLVERASNEHVIDVAPVGDSLGDQLVFVNPMFDAANQKEVGTSNGFCVRTVVGKTWHCNWMIHLARGQLAVSGTYPDEGDCEFAVVGGIGRYAGARGVIKVHARDAEHTSYDFTVTLL
jgi:allene oxide cyclase